MTSQFDNLMMIWGISRKDARFKPLANFIADLAVQDANIRKKGFTFGTWSESKRAQTLNTLYGEADLKWYFLDDCHDILDHTEWHLRVFKNNTAFLIGAIHDLFIGQEIWTTGLKAKTRPHYDKFISLIKECGAEITKYTITLKGVERRPY